MNSRFLVAGATSTIARAVCERLAGEGATLFLAARDVGEAERIGRDLQVRHEADAFWGRFEATDYDAHAALLDDAEDAMGGIDGVLVAAGTLGDADRAKTDPAEARRIVDVNYTGVVNLLTLAAGRLEAQGSGVIAAFSSVAGDRGRASNYVYGSAKAGLSAFLEGLRARLYGTGVHVLTIKPGPVDTAMTFGMDDPPPLMADPERVADDVVEALRRGTDVLYTPGIWRLIMAAIRAIPDAVFKRMSL
jgi:short-subunit dehydrogenase